MKTSLAHYLPSENVQFKLKAEDLHKISDKLCKI